MDGIHVPENRIHVPMDRIQMIASRVNPIYGWDSRARESHSHTHGSDSGDALTTRASGIAPGNASRRRDLIAQLLKEAAARCRWLGGLDGIRTAVLASAA